MRSPAVLVIGPDDGRSCAAAVLDMGLIPIVRSTMQEALRKLTREGFAAICIHAASDEIDVLECVLNIRDLDARTPILVVEADRARHLIPFLRRQRGVVLVDGLDLSRQLAAVVETVFSA